MLKIWFKATNAQKHLDKLSISFKIQLNYLILMNRQVKIIISMKFKINRNINTCIRK